MLSPPPEVLGLWLPKPFLEILWWVAPRVSLLADKESGFLSLLIDYLLFIYFIFFFSYFPSTSLHIYLNQSIFQETETPHSVQLAKITSVSQYKMLQFKALIFIFKIFIGV